VSLATHSYFVAPSHAACLLKADATRPEIPFSFPTNLGGGSFKKYAKGFLGEAQHSFAVLGGGAWNFQGFCLK